MWNTGLENMGTDFETELQKVCEHLSENKYDKVIVTNFEAGVHLDDEQYPLSEFYPQVFDYCYGWERESVEESGHVEGVEFCTGGTHSEVVLIDEWMHELEGKVYLCGAFDGECIEDMEIALEGAGKEFERIEELIN
tara:strand:+ start:232 stop:642 length:411 start_codon:yes stop_codon:yes gene_type:complete